MPSRMASSTSQAIPLQTVTPTNGSPVTAVSNPPNPAAVTAPSSDASAPVLPNSDARRWNFRGFRAQVANQITIERIAVVLGLVLTLVILAPTFRSADDGRRSREAADWGNYKDFLEYCEQVRSRLKPLRPLRAAII